MGVLRASNQSGSERLLFLEQLEPSRREMESWGEMEAKREEEKVQVVLEN